MFNLSLQIFENDFVSKNAISMCLLQIGELVSKLSAEVKAKYNKMPWRDIVALRNRAAHAYGSMDINVLWEIAIADIPDIKAYCEMIIAELSI